MNTSLEFLSDHILERKISEILRIKRNFIYILGIEFPVSVDNTGSFIKIKDIELDTFTSTKLTYQIWSLNFLNQKLQRSNDLYGTLELRKKVIELIITTMSNLKKSNTLRDVTHLLKNLERERNCIKKEIIDCNLVYQC